MSAQLFELTIGDQRVRAELLDDRAPRICQAFRACLPLESFAVHAKFAGEELIVMVPFVAADENPATSVAPGDIGYYPSRQTLCLFYGQIMPFASVTVFARVLPDDLPSARAAGEAVLRAGAAPARMTGDGAAGPASGAAGPASGSPSALLDRLAAATRAAWPSEPADVTRLRSYGRPPMGTMPCVVYANFDLFWAGENLQVCRALAEEGRLTGQQVGLTTAALLRRTASRLGKWGFADTLGLLEAVAADLESPSGSAAQPATLAAAIDGVQLYLDRVQCWLDAIVPWTEMDRSLRLLEPPTAPGGGSA
jgi:hypothetical protein